MTKRVPTVQPVDPLDEAIAAVEAPPEPRHFVTRDEILSADDLTREDVYCPEWGGWITIRSMNGKERGLWDDLLIANPDEVAGGAEARADTQDYQARLVALTAIDQDGNRLFTSDDKLFLGDKNAVPLYRCYTVAARLSRLTRKDMEELTATLGKGPSDSSGSA